MNILEVDEKNVEVPELHISCIDTSFSVAQLRSTATRFPVRSVLGRSSCVARGVRILHAFEWPRLRSAHLGGNVLGGDAFGSQSIGGRSIWGTVYLGVALLGGAALPALRLGVCLFSGLTPRCHPRNMGDVELASDERVCCDLPRGGFTSSTDWCGWRRTATFRDPAPTCP